MEQRSLWDIAADFLMHKHGYYIERPLTPDEMRSVIKEAIEWGSTSRWIAIADRAPELGVELLFVDRYGDRSVGSVERIYSGDLAIEWGDAGFRPIEEFTHWMSLPELPK